MGKGQQIITEGRRLSKGEDKHKRKGIELIFRPNKEDGETTVVQIPSTPDSNSMASSHEKTDLQKLMTGNNWQMAAGSEEEFDLMAFLKQFQVEYIDKRPKGGCLWLVGGQELKPIINECRKRGFESRFIPTGGRATKHRPGWFLKSIPLD